MTGSANPRPKIAVVTGATGGIGKWIALGMAQAGYIVVMIGRDRQRGEAAQAWIAGHVPGCRVDLLLADLALLAETATLGRRIATHYGVVDVLVLNAGIFLSRREMTREGHERVLAVNHLSPFVLTRELHSALQGAGRARIVTIGSDTSDKARIDPRNLELAQGWGMVRAYAQSKLAAMMTSFSWAEKLAPDGIAVNVVHPGLVGTGLIRTPGVIGLSWRLMKLFAKSEEQGAKTPLFVALGKTQVSGEYFKECQIAPPNKLARDEALRREVWEATVRLTA